MKANIPEAHRYGIAIVKRQYEAQKEQWAAMAEDKRGGKAFVKVRERKEGCAQINVHGSDKKEVGLLKVRVEALVRGEQLDASHWHSKFLWSAEGIADDVFERTRIHVYVDRKVLALRIYGAHGHTAVEAKALIREEVIRLNSMEHTIPIPRHLVRPFVDGDALKLLKEALGEDNISLEVTPSIACIRLSGGDDVIKHALKLVAENVAAPRTRDPTRIEAESDAPSCPVCYDSVTHPDTLVCGHSYCDPCLRHYLTSAASSAIFPLVCMGDGATCNRPISLPVIQRYLTQPKFNLLVDSVFSSHIRSNPQKYKFCPTPDCVQIYSLNSDQKIHQCPACLSETCLLCDKEVHEGMSCEERRILGDPAEQERLNEEWAQSNGAKKCPSCTVLTQKVDGCQHITCSGCQAHWCWVCGRAFDSGTIYPHLNEAHGGFY